MRLDKFRLRKKLSQNRSLLFWQCSLHCSQLTCSYWQRTNHIVRTRETPLTKYSQKVRCRQLRVWWQSPLKGMLIKRCTSITYLRTTVFRWNCVLLRWKHFQFAEWGTCSVKKNFSPAAKVNCSAPLFPLLFKHPSMICFHHPFDELKAEVSILCVHTFSSVGMWAKDCKTKSS